MKGPSALGAALLGAALLGAAAPAPGADDAPAAPSRLTVLPPEESPALDPAVDAVSRKFDRDLDYLLSSPFRVTPRGGAWAAGTAAVTLLLLDDDRDRLAGLAETGGRGVEKASARLHSLGGHIPEAALALYLGGYLLDSPRLKADSLQGVEAVALTALFTAVSAPVIGHAAPGQTGGPDDFRGFGRFHSMPDMDTGLAFALAGAIGYGKGFWANLGCYTVAAGVGFSRAHERDAWPSDVFLGAALGTAVGRAVSWLSSPEGGGGRISLGPALVDSPSGPAAGLEARWEY